MVKPEGDNPNTNNSISSAKLSKDVEMSYNPDLKVIQPAFHMVCVRSMSSLSVRSRLRRQKAIVERDGVCTGCHHIAGSIDADVVDGRWRLPTANLVNLFFVLGRKGIEQIAP